MQRNLIELNPVAWISCALMIEPQNRVHAYITGYLNNYSHAQFTSLCSNKRHASMDLDSMLYILCFMTFKFRAHAATIISLILDECLEITRRNFRCGEPRLQCSMKKWCVNESSQIARFMGPTWDPPGSCRTQMGPMLAPWTLLSGSLYWKPFY